MLEQSDTHSCCNLYRQIPTRTSRRGKYSSDQRTRILPLQRRSKLLEIAKKISLQKLKKIKTGPKNPEKNEVYLFSEGLELRFTACTDAQTSSRLYYGHRCTIFFLYSNECKCKTEKFRDRNRSRSSSPQLPKRDLQIARPPARSFVRSFACSATKKQVASFLIRKSVRKSHWRPRLAICMSESVNDRWQGEN